MYTWQDGIAIALVLATVAWLARQSWLAIATGKSSCGSGCGKACTKTPEGKEVVALTLSKKHPS